MLAFAANIDSNNGISWALDSLCWHSRPILTVTMGSHGPWIVILAFTANISSNNGISWPWIAYAGIHGQY
jgi:hypothetical protein